MHACYAPLHHITCNAIIASIFLAVQIAVVLVAHKLCVRVCLFKAVTNKHCSHCTLYIFYTLWTLHNVTVKDPVTVRLADLDLLANRLSHWLKGGEGLGFTKDSGSLSPLRPTAPGYIKEMYFSWAFPRRWIFTCEEAHIISKLRVEYSWCFNWQYSHLWADSSVEDSEHIPVVTQ